MKRLFPLVFLCLLTFVVRIHAADDVPGIFGGADNLTIFNEAKTVTVPRLAPPEGDENRDRFDPRKYRVLNSKPVPAKALGELRKIFGDRGSYLFGGAKGCIPRYGVRLTFQSDKGTVALDLCLECGIVSIDRDGKGAGGGVFDPAVPRVTRIVKALFPKDKAMQEFTP
jgi:hypothetical protein